MVYLMTLFAKWSEWMSRRLSICRSSKGGNERQNFGRGIMKSLFS